MFSDKLVADIVEVLTTPLEETMAQNPIPDFTQAGLHLEAASRELQEQFQRINQIPAVQLQENTNQLNNLTRAIQTLTQTITRLENKIDNM